MKNLKQKLLISLIFVMCLFIGRSFAETINVVNWNPWGVLKLNQIILKTGTNATGIILYGNSSNAYIQIARWNPSAASGIVLSGNTSTISVNRICDANGNNCRNVTNILTGNGGGGYWKTSDSSTLTTSGNYQVNLGNNLMVTGSTTLRGALNFAWQDDGNGYNFNKITTSKGSLNMQSSTINITGTTVFSDLVKIKTGTNSKIWVNNICDANGSNCKTVASLGGGGGGGYWKKPSNSTTLYTSGGDYSIAVNNISASGTTTLNGQLNVFQRARLYDGLSIQTGNLTVAGNTTLQSGLTVSKQATLNSGLTVKTLLSGSTTSTSAFWINNNWDGSNARMSMYGETYLSGNTEVYNSVLKITSKVKHNIYPNRGTRTMSQIQLVPSVYNSSNKYGDNFHENAHVADYAECGPGREGTITYYRKIYTDTQYSYGYFKGCVCAYKYTAANSNTIAGYKCYWTKLSERLFYDNINFDELD